MRIIVLSDVSLVAIAKMTLCAYITLKIKVEISNFHDMAAHFILSFLFNCLLVFL